MLFFQYLIFIVLFPFLNSSDEIYHSDEGTYNTLINQYGFCKMQGIQTTNRENSLGPSIYTSGKVQFGVGLSSLYFGDIPNKEGKLTCGMCLNITKIYPFPTFSNDLTSFDENIDIKTPFSVMVFDQCKDPICKQEGFLDFDIYSNIPPNNIDFIEWNTIECPIDDSDTIELLFCSSTSCNTNYKYNERKLWRDIVNPYFLTVIPRNMKVPIEFIKVWNSELSNYEDLDYISSIGWTFPFSFLKDENLDLNIISLMGEKINIKISIKKLLKSKILLEYNGGILYNTKKQFIS